MNILFLLPITRLWLVAISLWFVPLGLQAATTRKVTNTHDSGVGSLRTTISNAAAGDTIVFDIPTTDPGYDASTNLFTILLTSGQIAIPPLLEAYVPSHPEILKIETLKC